MRFSIPSFSSELPPTVAALPHPTAIKLAGMIQDRVAEAMRLMGAVHLGDKNTIKQILNLNDANFQARLLPALAAYMHGTRVQVEAALAAAEAVQSQANAKVSALHGYGDYGAATQDANAALAATDPAAAAAIVNVVQQKGQTPFWKYGAAAAGAYLLYRGVKHKPLFGRGRGFSAFGDAGLISGPLLLGAAALVPLLLHKSSLPPPPPPPPPSTGGAGGSSDPLSTVQGIVTDGQKLVGVGTAVAGLGGTATALGLGPMLAAAAPAAGIGAVIVGGLALDALGTKAIIDKVGVPAGIAIAVGTAGFAPMAVGVGTAVSAVANKIAPLIGISGSEGSVVSSVSAGTMIRRDSGDTNAVYLTDSKGQKHHLTSMGVVNALGGDVVRMTAANVDAMPNSFDVGSGAEGLAIRTGNVLAPSTMIRRSSGDTSAIYITDEQGQKHHITDMGYVDARGGPGAVITLSATTVDTMASGPDVGSAHGPVIPPPPPPTPVPVAAAAAAAAAGAKALAAVMPVLVAPAAPVLPVPANSMIRRRSGDTGSIYQMDASGVKHHVRSMNYVNARGGSGAVKQLAAPVVDAMPNGPEVG